MKTIILTNGAKSFIDDQDYDLNQFSWHQSTSGYVVRTDHDSGKQKTISIHIEIAKRMKIVSKVDHEDCNSLNNQQSNLRPATDSQNQMNQRLGKNNTTCFKGVMLDKHNGRYFAQIRYKGDTNFLGYFDTPEEAARTYDTAARCLFKQFGRYNYPKEGEQGL